MAPSSGPQARKRTRKRRSRPVIGWREWVALPELGGARIKAKVDTGARTSALHAYDVVQVDRDGDRWVRFTVHPIQRDTEISVVAEAPLAGYRTVTSSAGVAEVRPVITTGVELAGVSWPIELTLTRRDEMGFRMLLGRAAVRRRFVVDPGRSFLAERIGQDQPK